MAFAKLQSRAGQARANARCAADEGGRCRNAALPRPAATGRIDQQPSTDGWVGTRHYDD